MKDRKKIIAFICLQTILPIHFNSLDNGLGGSETWLIKMSKELTKAGYHIIIFQSSREILLKDNIEIVPLSIMANRLSYQKINHLIFYRICDFEILSLIKEYDCCDNIYMIAHDQCMWKYNNTDKGIQFYPQNNNCVVSWYDDINTSNYYKNHIKCLFLMSDWHYSINRHLYPREFIEIIGNGIDIPNDESEIEKDNSILWSSCYERGIDILVDKIAPLVRKEIPDFQIYTCSYNNNLPEQYKNQVIDLGSLNKTDLYNEIKKHKVWFLPLSYWETFCITALENIVNDVEIVIPYDYGLTTTLKYFKDNCIYKGDYNNNEYCQYVADEIIQRIKNYNNEDRKLIRSFMKNIIKDNYSWKTISQKFINILSKYEKNNSNNS